MTVTPRHILIVDSSPEYLDFMSMLLTGEGYEVTYATTMEATAARLAAAVPDLVICDLLLPGAPPLAVLDMLHAGEKTRDVPVLVCTGALDQMPHEAARLRCPGREVLSKPFDIDDLLAAVARLTERP